MSKKGKVKEKNQEMVNQERVKEYELRRPLQDEFTAKIKDLLKSLLHTKGIEIHLIESRTKGVLSFAEKIRRASKEYKDPLAEITDLSGIRIIVYYLEDIKTVCEVIEREFVIDPAKSVDSGARLRPEEFGYQSVHYVARLSTPRRNLAEWLDLRSHCAEIQVRTVFQHAWAAISHKLQYKNEQDIPRELRRKLFRLSALLEMADEELLDLRHRQADLSRIIEQNLRGELTDLDINLLSIDEYLRTAKEVKELAAHAVVAGFTWAADEDKNDPNEKRSSDLVQICKLFGLSTISEVQKIIRSSLLWTKSYFANLRTESKMDWIVNPDFLCILVLIRAYKEQVTIEHLVKMGWHEEVARRVLRVVKG